MSEFTLPGRARKRRGPDPSQALIPCATGTATATHLIGDRYREPTFEDLLAGNDREPSHADLLVDDEDDQDLKPAARELPIVYPGVSAEALAWLREQDQPYVPNVRDEHAFDVNRLVPGKPLRRTVDLTRAGTDETPPVMPAGSPRLLFDALDALDRLPALYAIDAAAFEMAASIAAIQTYAALRPDLLGTHAFRMQVTPLAEQLAAPTPEPANHAGQLAAAWTSIRETQARFGTTGFVPDHRFATALRLDALDELIDNLIDALGDVRGVFDAEADDIELYAIEAGLPMTEATLKGQVAL